MFNVLRAGLKSDVKTAKEAGHLAITVADSGQNDLVSFLDDAYIYWLKNEEPMRPTKDNVTIVPDSPRAEILEALMNIKPVTYEELSSYLTDSRSDVQDVAADHLIKQLQPSDGPRLQFLSDIGVEALPSNLLAKALESMAQLNREELAQWEELLSSRNPKIRFGAMSLLDKKFLDSARINAHAAAMTGDNEQEIRDRAYRILNML